MLFPLPAAPHLAELAAPLLSGPERHRAGRFRFAADRHRWMVGRALVRLAVAGGGRADAARLPLVDGDDGKPYCPQPGAKRFSLSHTRGTGRDHIGLLALAGADTEVGVDVEAVRPVDDLCATAAMVLTPGELAWVGDRPEPHRAAAFLRLWTCKEAVLKAMGCGLRIDPRALEIGPLPADAPVNRPVAPPGPATGGASRPWCVSGVAVGDGLVAALACDRPAAVRVSVLTAEDVTRRLLAGTP